MINYRNRITALLILVLFATSHFMPIISVAHDPCAEDWEQVEKWQGKLRDAQRNLRNIKERGYLQTIVKEGKEGFIIGGIVGLCFGPGILPVAAAALTGGMIDGVITHYNEVQAAQDVVDYALTTLNSYYAAWQRCDTKYRNHKHSSSSNPDCTICFGSGACTVCDNSN